MLLPIVFFIVLVVLLFLWLISEKRTKHKELINQYKEEYVFSMFFSVAFAILSLFGFDSHTVIKRKGISKKSKEKRIQQFRTLYGDMEYKKHYWFNIANMISAVYVVVILTVLLIFVVSLQEAKNASDFQINLKRPDYGESKLYNVRAEFKSDNEVIEKDVEIIIESLLPNEEEAMEILEGEKVGLLEYIKYENDDLNTVVTDLRLPTANESKGIDIKWVSSNPTIIGRTGKVVNTGIDAPVEVTITAILSIGELYSDEIKVVVTVLPKPIEEVEVEGKVAQKAMAESVELILAEIQNLINEDLTAPMVEMPQKWGDTITIRWIAKEKTKLPVIILIAFLFGGFVVYYLTLKTKENLSERKERIKMDFPEMLNKLVLLIGAGTTVSTAMDKIISDYRGSKEKRALYEELIILNESIYGDKKMNYIEAYEAFAKRCMVPEAIRFAALMIQHERTGTSQLTSMLRLFSNEAWQERKRIAERRGKMAENKLLLPILLIFLAVLIIVLMPITTMMNI